MSATATEGGCKKHVTVVKQLIAGKH